MDSIKDFRTAIKEILRFKKVMDPLDDKISGRLKGNLGEYYVCVELLRKGYQIKPKGGQGGCDIFLPEINKRIEVRTSLLKNEGTYDANTYFYGWRVRNRNQKSDNKFDFMVGVALDKSFKRPKYYIFTYGEAYKVGDVVISRFKNVQKKIHLFENIQSMKQAIKLQPELVTDYEVHINHNQKKFLGRWNKIE